MSKGYKAVIFLELIERAVVLGTEKVHQSVLSNNCNRHKEEKAHQSVANNNCNRHKEEKAHQSVANNCNRHKEKKPVALVQKKLGDSVF